jgi:hypothetical protein
MIVDILSGVAENLNNQVDRSFNETQLQYAQQRRSLLNLAQNLGVSIQNKRGSITVCDFTVIIPTLGDTDRKSVV